MAVVCLEGFLPLSLFTHRPWEALLYRHAGVGMPFYPNQSLQMLSTGDLRHHTSGTIEKNERWVTDPRGYRNDHFIEKADILLVGDSFMAGATITQDSTLSNTLMRKYHDSVKVYNMAPASFADFVTLLEKGVIKKPRLLIFSVVEGTVPKPINARSDNGQVYESTPLSVLEDRITRLYALNYLKARLFNRHGRGIPGADSSDMFFLNRENQRDDKATIDRIVRTMAEYQAYCQAAGIAFLFMPMPNKETVYFEQVPLPQQPDYLFRLDSKLRSKTVATLNALAVFNRYRQHSNKLLYHLDDSHWNATGVNVIADELVKVTAPHLGSASEP